MGSGILGTALLLAAAASPEALRPLAPCAPTPLAAVERFITGIPFDLGLMKSAVGGRRLGEVFGAGDRARGEAIIREIVRSPDVDNGVPFGSAYSLIALGEKNGAYAAMVERHDSITRAATDGREEEEERVYLRGFLLQLDNLNCIRAIMADRRGWQRIK